VPDDATTERRLRHFAKVSFNPQSSLESKSGS
jgi:hypothetical protein